MKINIINLYCIMFSGTSHKSILVVAIMLGALNGFTQSKNTPCHLALGNFKLDHEPDLSLFMDSYDWSINHQHVDRKKDAFDFVTHYPQADTIYFSNNEEQDTVVTRFKPGHTYYLTMGAGMAGFDLYDKNTRRRPVPPPDHAPDRKADSIWCMKQNPAIDFKIENFEPNDSLACFYADFYGCQAMGKYITQNGPIHFVQPSKNTFEENLVYIRIVKIKSEALSKPALMAKNSSPVHVSHCEDIVELASVHVRFMHNEKVTAVYDVRTKKLKLEVK